MTTPIRIQRKRTPGWKMPPNTVYVGRPTKWGNPWFVEGDLVKIVNKKTAQVWIEGGGGLKACLAMYRAHAIKCLPVKELKGKNLACFCRTDQPCHADVLLQLANKGD